MLTGLGFDLFVPPIAYQTDPAGGAGGSTTGKAESGDGTNDAGSTGDGDKDKAGTGDQSKLTLTAEQQAEMDRLIEERVKRAERVAAEEARKAERKRIEDEAKAKTASESGDWKTLAEAAQTRAAELEAEVKKRDRDDLARTVAEKHGLAPAAAKFLTGDTEDELTAQAKELKKFAGTREAPDTDGGKGSTSGGGNQDTQAKTSNKPIPKSDGEPAPIYTIDGRQKVRWDAADR